jgi:RimJ/RimL family protein N-acetyltransferase
VGRAVIALRRAAAEDADFLAALARQESVEPFMGVRGPRDREAVLAEIDRAAAEPAMRGWYVIEEDGEPVGGVAFEVVNEHNRIAHLHRLAIDPAVRGRGVGEEAVRLFTRHLVGEHGFHRIELETYGFNERAIRLFERAGFKREGVKRSAYWRNGCWNDSVCFGLLADDGTAPT